jgi:transcriptional regulator with XRE-family HTH domain
MPLKIITSGEIGARIRTRRKELGLSQEQLAEKVGVSYQQVQRYENGSSTLNVENVQRIAHALGVPTVILVEGEDSRAAAKSIAVGASSFWSSDEKVLVRLFRQLSTPADKKLAISVIRRFARK